MAWTKPEAQNAEIAIDQGMILIRINPEERFGPSSTGKTIIVAKATLDVPGYPGMVVSLTAYTKAK